MKLRIKNQLRGEIMVFADSTHDGETTVTIASAKTLPPFGSVAIQSGDAAPVLNIDLSADDVQRASVRVDGLPRTWKETAKRLNKRLGLAVRSGRE